MARRFPSLSETLPDLVGTAKLSTANPLPQHRSVLAVAPGNVEAHVVLSVLAGAACAALRQRLAGYATATPATLQRRFLETGGVILNRGEEIVCRLERRTYSPVLRQAEIPEVAVPWWGGRRLRFEFA